MNVRVCVCVSLPVFVFAVVAVVIQLAWLHRRSHIKLLAGLQCVRITHFHLVGLGAFLLRFIWLE